MLKVIRYFLVISLTICLVGCGTFGPHVLPYNRELYNLSLEGSDEEQFLLNLVRLRYGDTPYFLNVDSISASMEFNAGGASTIINRVPRGSLPLFTQVSATAAVATNEKPLISYRPLQGAAFARELLRPIHIENLVFLGQSGWSVARLLRVTVQRMGDLNNASEAARVTSKHAPEYEEFLAFAHYLRLLDRTDVVDLSAEKHGSAIFVRIHFIGNQTDRASYMRLLRMLGIKQFQSNVFFVESAQRSINENTFGMSTRSLIGVLYYLSKGVDAPPEDVKKGRIPQTYMENGQLFDWRQVLQGIIHIRYSNYQPKNAYVSVYYRGHWFYISDSDTDSKETFSLLSLLFSLQVSESESTSPMLSVAV